MEALSILLALGRHDYGRPERGDSYEYASFMPALRALGHTVQMVDTLDAQYRLQPKVARRRLFEAIEETRPNLAIFFTFENETPTAVLSEVRQHVTTVNWFADDEWRFNIYSRHIAPFFDLVITTSLRAEAAYQGLHGCHAVFMPWAFDQDIFHPTGDPLTRDVAFVGQSYGRRSAIVSRLRSQGIDVYTRGVGWPEGRAEWGELSGLFGSSRVNLAVLDSSAGPVTRRGWSFRGAYRLEQVVNRVKAPAAQFKARVFEIPAAGGLLLSQTVPEMLPYMTPGVDYVEWRRPSELPNLIRKLIHDEDQRSAVAANGLRRMQEGHSWSHRLAQVIDHASRV